MVPHFWGKKRRGGRCKEAIGERRGSAKAAGRGAFTVDYEKTMCKSDEGEGRGNIIFS